MAGPYSRGGRRRRAQGGPDAVAQAGGHRLFDPGERKMRRFFAVLALAFLAAALAAPARAANIQNVDLGKNAEVWFAEDHTLPIISFNISLPAGSAYDPAGKAGLANFAASMIDE